MPANPKTLQQRIAKIVEDSDIESFSAFSPMDKLRDIHAEAVRLQEEYLRRDYLRRYKKRQQIARRGKKPEPRPLPTTSRQPTGVSYGLPEDHGSFKNFLRDRCVLRYGAQVVQRDLYVAYVEYCRKEELEYATDKQFSQVLVKLPGITRRRTNASRLLCGVELISKH